ncbi:MAG TPA: hypothetical protein VKK31_21860 [Thermoanaerobaculia bacterium]|nr:hypothetical protein [Thermoanaerobaculia bacterium]
MDALNREALDALAAAVRSFLPAAADPALAPSVAIFPKRIAATGIGGLVGLQEDPEGEIVGRQIDAEVRVTVRAAAASGLNAAAEGAVQGLVAAGRLALAERGIFSVQLARLGEKASPEGGNAAEMDLAFQVRYELIKRPEEAGEVIREIPIDLRLTS